MRRFDIGDVALIRSLPEIHPEYRDRECTVLSKLVSHPRRRYAVHRIEIAGISKRMYAAPHQLKPLPPPDLPGAWAECVFRPKALEARE